MKKYLEILKKCPLFYGIEDDEMIAMLHCLRAKTDVFDKKYTVMAENSKAGYIGIVLSGSVQTERTDIYGNRSIIEVSGAGEIFSEAFACSSTERLPVNVVAVSESEIMFIDCTHILHTCKNNCSFHNRLIFNLMKEISEKTVLFHQKLEILSKRTTREKLLCYLSMCAKKEGKTSFYIPFDRQELADYLETDRSGLSAEIGKLQRDGILESRKNYFRLIKYDGNND